MSCKHLIIAGVPRSGTTLLASMIGSHPEVAMLIEDQDDAILRLAGSTVSANKLCVPNQIKLDSRRSPVTSTWRRLGRHWPEWAPGEVHAKRPTASMSFNDYMALEDPYLILITRHPKSVVSSIEKRTTKSADLARDRWNLGVVEMRAAATKWADLTTVVAYEQLVAEPESLMRGIAHDLGLRFDETMLEGWKKNPFYNDRAGIETHRADEADLALDADVPADAVEAYAFLQDLAAAELSDQTA